MSISKKNSSLSLVEVGLVNFATLPVLGPCYATKPDSEGYSEIGKFYVDESKKLVLKMHITGRTQVYGDGETLYGVQACGQ